MGWAGEKGAGSRGRLQSGGRRGVAGVIWGALGWVGGSLARAQAAILYSFTRQVNSAREKKHREVQNIKWTGLLQLRRRCKLLIILELKLVEPTFDSSGLALRASHGYFGWPTVYRVQFISAA